MICVFFTAEEDWTPTYALRAIPELESGEFTYGGQKERDIRMHIQDFGENGSDYAHFATMHPKMYAPILKHLFTVVYRPEWERDAETTESGLHPFAYFRDHPHMIIRGFDHHTPENVSVEVEMNGPAIFIFRFRTPLGMILVQKTYQPRGPLLMRLSDTWYHETKIPKIVVRLIMNEAIAAFDDDIRVWNHKSYSFKPILASGDGPMGPMRRWYKQFYSKNSYLVPPPAKYRTHLPADEEEVDEKQ